MQCFLGYSYPPIVICMGKARLQCFCVPYVFQQNLFNRININHRFRRPSLSMYFDSLADPVGRTRRAPPKGSDSFALTDEMYDILRNVVASGVGVPPYEVGAPLREILDPPLWFM